MAKGKRWARMLAGLAVLALVSAACGDDDGGTVRLPPRASRDRSRSRVHRRSSPSRSLVAELFNETNPDVEITVEGPGTGDGFELFCQGEIDIADASRAIDEEDEVPACEDGRDRVRGARGRARRDHRDGELRQLASSASPPPTCTRSSVRNPSGINSTTDANALSRGGGRRRHDAVAGPRGHRSGRGVGNVRRVHRALGDPRPRGRARRRRGGLRGASPRLSVVAERQRDHPGDGGKPERDRVRGLRVR